MRTPLTLNLSAGAAALAIGSLIAVTRGLGVAHLSPLMVAGIVVPLAALAISVASTGRGTVFSASNVFLGLYVPLVHVGALIFYSEAPALNSRFLLASSASLAVFSIGQLLVRLSSSQRAQGDVPPISNDVVSGRGFVWRLLTVAGIVGAIAYIAGGVRTTGIPLIDVAQRYGDPRSFGAARQTFVQSTGAGGYLFELYAIILPLSALAFLLRYLVTRNKKHRRVAVVLAIVAFVPQVITGYRGDAMRFALLFMIGLNYHQGATAKAFSRRLGLLALGCFVMLTAIIQPGAASGSLWELIRNRLFVIQALGPQFVYASEGFDEYPVGHFLVEDLRGVLPGRQSGLSSQLPQLRGVRSSNNPIGSTADAYVNFRFAGMLVFMFVLGGLCQVLHRQLLHGRRTVTNITLYAGLTSAVAYSAIAGIVGTVWQYGIFTIGVVALLMSILGDWRGNRSLASNLGTRGSNRLAIPHA